MNMDFLNSKPLKVAVVFLAVVSVVLIVGAAIGRWQYTWQKGIHSAVIMPNGVPLPPLPQTEFYGYPVSPPLSHCVGTRLEERSFGDKIKSFFASKKKLIEEMVALCEAEEARATKEWEKKKQQEALTLEKEEKEKRANKVTLEELPVVELPPFTVNWLPMPEKLDDTPLFQNDGNQNYEPPIFKMGNTSSGGEVIYFIENGGLFGSGIDRWIKTSEGVFVLLEKQSDMIEEIETTTFDRSDVLAGKLARCLQNHISGVDVPDMFEHAGMSWRRNKGIFVYDIMLSDESEKPEHLLASLSFGDLYSQEKKNQEYPKLGSVQYFIRIADGIYLNYALSDGRADDSTFVANWKSGREKFKTLPFTAGINNGGCGSVGDNRYYPKKGEMEEYEKVGDLKAGGALYLVTGLENVIVEYLFKDVQYSSKPDTSREEFSKHVTILLSPDPFGQGYLFYSFLDDPSLGSMVECAKPVIYLYPEKTTDVSVAVGAHITKSEPEYGSGWKVTAEPNGTLRDENGKEWQSLFWDGTGSGEYPAIREGRVVSRSNIREALEGDLRALGLNDRERADFLEFWLPHMPNTPYVRLTWLTTNEMNSLAPLAVSPRPDTMIRVFLDFAGQESSETDLKPQILSSIPRKGFTLIEWGGLLHSSKNIR